MSHLRVHRGIHHDDSRQGLRASSPEFCGSHQEILLRRKQWTHSPPDTTATVDALTDPIHASTVPTGTTRPVRCVSSPVGTLKGSWRDSRRTKPTGKPTVKTQVNLR